ncbi:uncharacterized protein LOC134291270 [Aedes albopictus]|uniref:RRM domain-containing protein n=1 Tax=Aedes albopictus TaxID=7160 RepID=A0ABM1Y643_AEDAL
MSAIKRRENTFRVDYANVPKKPTSEEVHQFVGVTLGLKREEVLRIQYSRSNGIAYVKATSLEVAQKTVEEHDNKHEMTIDGKPYKLRLLMEDGAVEVRLFNLSEDVTNDKIVKFLSAFGELHSIREELWDDGHLFSGLPTGVRTVRMTVKINIPSYVTIDGERTNLAYYGQQQTCKYCSEHVHNGVSCVQNKKLLVQKLAANSTSYADVMKHPNLPRTKPSSSQRRPDQLAVKLGRQPTQKAANENADPTTSRSMHLPGNDQANDDNNHATKSDEQQQKGHESEPWVRVPNTEISDAQKSRR